MYFAGTLSSSIKKKAGIYVSICFMKSMSEEKVFIKEKTKDDPLQEVQEEKQNTENFSEDDMAVLDIFSSFPG